LLPLLISIIDYSQTNTTMNLYISILKYFIACCVLHATVEGQELSGKLDNIIWAFI